MSPQSSLFTVCLVAGLVALVAAQGMNPTECASKAQREMSAYARSVQTIVREFSQGLSSSAQQSLNINGLTGDLNGLAENYLNFTNLDNGINVQELMKTATSIMDAQMKLVMKYFLNPELSLSTMRAGVALNSKLLAANLDFVTRLSQACVPRS